MNQPPVQSPGAWRQVHEPPCTWPRVKGHCKTCRAYEAAVMDGAAADDVAPCDDYEMTETFREWLVGKMRDEVAAAVSGSGLDRMAILRQKDD